MQWTIAEEKQPRVGATKEVRRFLFFPKLLMTNEETYVWKWLERAMIVQKLMRREEQYTDHPSDLVVRYVWVDVKWGKDK